MSEQHDAGRSPAMAWVWIGVLALTSSVQFGRGAPIDGAVFAVFAALLAAERVGLLPNVRPARGPRGPRGPALVLLALGCAVVLIVAPFDGGVSRTVLVLIGLGSVAYFWPQERPPRSPRQPASAAARTPPPASERAIRRRTAVLWAMLVVLVCLWELAAFFLGHGGAAAEQAHPTISSLVEPFVASPWGRLVFVPVWVMGGLALLRVAQRAGARR